MSNINSQRAAHLAASARTQSPAVSSVPAHGSAHSWPEDFPHENGNYSNVCYQCKTVFAGHKRRLVCKVCATENARIWDAMSEEERQQHIARRNEAIKQLFGLNKDSAKKSP